jgi:hypothetical protein
MVRSALPHISPPSADRSYRNGGLDEATITFTKFQAAVTPRPRRELNGRFYV